MKKGSDWLLFVFVAAMIGLSALSFVGCTSSEMDKICIIYTTYNDAAARKECASFCETHTDFKRNPKLVHACQVGQVGYLQTKLTASALVDRCDKYFDDVTEARACRFGVQAEDGRFSRNPHGMAEDRGIETGNRR